MRAEYVGRKPAPSWMRANKQAGMPDEVKVWRVWGWLSRPRLLWGEGPSLFDAETGEPATPAQRRAVYRADGPDDSAAAERRCWWKTTPFVEGIPEMPERFALPEDR